MVSSRLKYQYGITLDEYEAMLRSQNGVCALCNKGETRTHNGKTTRLVVDHDHVSGDVRALLCHNCNVMIGHSGDDPTLLRSAAAYIERGGL